MVRILIIDNNAESWKATEEMFSLYGDCEFSAIGQDAIDHFRVALSGKKPVDLVALDLSQKYDSGIGIIKAIRDLEKERNILENEYVKIMVTTDLRKPEIIKACAEAGCNSYVLKPLKKDVLAEKLSGLGLHQETKL